jgi:tetratricopeptide (TPR) repeat protein
MMPKPAIDQLIEQANQAAGRQDWKTAYSILSSAAESADMNPGVCNALGVCLLQLGKPKEAAGWFEKLTRLIPASGEAYCSLGMAYAGCGELALAENAYLKALQSAPDTHAARKGLAVVYLQQSMRYGEGIQILNSLYHSDPQDIETILMLANCYEQGENFSRSKKYFELALEIEPKNDLAKQGLARVKTSIIP